MSIVGANEETVLSSTKVPLPKLRPSDQGPDHKELKRITVVASGTNHCGYN